jgi:hypothetical protein
MYRILNLNQESYLSIENEIKQILKGLKFTICEIGDRRETYVAKNTMRLDKNEIIIRITIDKDQDEEKSKEAIEKIKALTNQSI